MKYAELFPSGTGNVAKPLRMALGSLIIQTKFQYSDRELVEQITENPYLQYFIGLACQFVLLSARSFLQSHRNPADYNSPFNIPDEPCFRILVFHSISLHGSTIAENGGKSECG